jgi:hypothetical protein
MEPRGSNWWQSVAIRVGADAAKTKPKPLPWIACSCRKERMVRRGSTVRVGQRALQKPRKPGLSRFLVCIDLVLLARAVGVEHVVEQSGFWRPLMTPKSASLWPNTPTPTRPRESNVPSLRALSSGFVRATLQDNPSMTADEIRTIVTGGEGQTLEFKETTAQMPRAVKTLAASVIMNRA